MPWQADWFDVIGEYYVDDDTGLLMPFYREAFFTTPRQSGKTTVLLAWVWDRGLLWGGPQLIGWTAQTGKDGRDKWLSELYPRIEQSDVNQGVKSLHRGMGNEAMHMRTGSTCRLLGSTMTAGHGGTYNGAVLDEIFADHDWRRDQMFVPAMSTIDDGQRLVCSTAGDALSVVYNSKVKRGRQAVANDTDSGLAYLEFSADPKWDEDDEESYWDHMPALGFTQSISAIREAKETLAEEPGEFRRAFGNIPNGGSTVRVIPEEMWNAVVAPAVTPSGKMGVGIDVAEDQSWSAVGVADDQGRVELAEHREGTGWLIGRANEIAGRLGAKVAFDKQGPAAALAGDLRKGHGFGSDDIAQATGWFYLGVVDRKLRVRDSPELDDSVEGAVKKLVGDRFVWSRKASTTDPTPLIAATLAVWMAKTDTGGGGFAVVT